MKKALYTVNQVWTIFGGAMSKTLLYKMVRTGKIPCVHIGKGILNSGAWVEKILDEAAKVEV